MNHNCFTSTKEEDILENDDVRIYIDCHIKTTIYISNNKPDLLILDKKGRKAMILEIGITNIHDLARVEEEKTDKYRILADEIQGQMNLKKVSIVPVVFTWEGLVSKYMEKQLGAIGLRALEIAYIQTRILKRTLESFLSFNKRTKLDTT